MNNKPRPKLERQNALRHVSKSINAPRPKANENSPVMNRLSANEASQMNDHLKQGLQKMHKRSDTVLHQERAFVYGQIGRGKMQQRINSAMTGLNPMNKVSRARRTELSSEAQKLAPYHQRYQERNAEGLGIEKTGNKLRNAAVAANAVDTVGTGVALLNPAAGALTKAVAKGATVGFGVAAATAYDRAAVAYKRNVDESATGMQMLDSQISQAHADMATTKRNKAIVSTAATGISMMAGMGMAGMGMSASASVKAGGAKVGVEASEITGRGLLKMGATRKIQQKNNANERRMKSEVVGLMQHQMGREMKVKLDPLDNDMPGPRTNPTELKRQNGRRDVNPDQADYAGKRAAALGKRAVGRAIVLK